VSDPAVSGRTASKEGVDGVKHRPARGLGSFAVDFPGLQRPVELDRDDMNRPGCRACGIRAD
jgi:hypothetical protein